MIENYIVLDFESYYCTKTKYSLQSITPVEYVLDPRFELIGCAVIDKGRGSNYHDPYWCDAPDWPDYVRRLKERQKLGEKLVVMSHNALFDMCVLVWRYGLVPNLMIDSMGMARAMLAPKVGKVSLAAISDHLGLGQKGDTVMHVNGMRRADIIARGFYEAYKAYSIKDAVLCEGIYQKLAPTFPGFEVLVNDMVIRCAVLPKFQLHVEELYDHLADVKQRKADLYAEAGISVDEYGKAPELMSNEKFAELLRQHGVEPPMKMSPTTGEFTYAFAKSDQGMADLQEHEDEAVQTLVAARIGAKSTLEESRTERFISIGNLGWGSSNKQARWLPVPLRFSGAHTHRLSGDWKLNLQNLPRGGRLRKALVAPDGHVVIACDASQIEARIVAWLAQCVTGLASALVQAFADGDDVYSLFATEHIYHRTITKADVKERFVGKQAILGLGFGMGDVRYRVQVRKDSRLQLNIIIDLTEEQSKQIVQGYRKGMAPQVPRAWKLLTHQIGEFSRYDTGYEFGPVKFGFQEITGPTGLKMFYPELAQVYSKDAKFGGTEWKFKSGRMHKKLFGGKLYENIVQHLARCCNMETALKMRRHFGVDLALQAHDELVYVVPGSFEVEHLPNDKTKHHPVGFAKEFMQTLRGFMRERPAWGPDLPLDAEAGIGNNYGEAK